MFRFAILGAGKIAVKFADAAREAGCEVVAVASKSLEKANAFARDNGVVRAYGDYAALLDAERPDCAYIATVPSSHYELSRLCMEKGVPALCEKAMFRDSGEAESAFALSEDKGVFLMEALWSKFLPANRQAKKWLDEGRIGKPILADSAIGFTAPKDPSNRYFNPDLGGGAALDITVYAYEIAAFVFGARPAAEYVAVTRGSTGTDDTEVAVMRVGDCPLTVRASFTANLDNALTIYGEKGKIVVPNQHVASEAFLFDGQGKETEHFRDTETKNGFAYEVREVVRCVREGRVESDVQPHADTIACARLFDAIRRA